MKIDTSARLIVMGKAVSLGGDVAEATIKDVIMQSLSYVPPNTTQTMDDSARRWKIAKIVGEGGEVSIESGDIDFIKRVSVPWMNPLAWGAFCDFLEGA